MFDWSLKLKEELRDDKGIQHIKEIYIVKEGKNDCDHVFILNPDGRFLGIPTRYHQMQICNNCGQLESVTEYNVDNRKQEFRELYQKFHDWI